MELSTITKEIQKIVGVSVDGVYGPQTGNAILNTLNAEVSEEVPDAADSNYPEVFKPTPNVSSGTISPIGVVLHHSSGSYNGSVDWILKTESQVSYHVIIDKDGSRTVFAEDNKRCWHAGKSEWNGRSDCNSFMIGLAFSEDTNTRELTEAEVASAVEWLVPRFKKWGWPTDLNTVTTHAIVSPGRKNDVDTRAYLRITTALSKEL